jgi:hypothetical protein
MSLHNIHQFHQGGVIKLSVTVKMPGKVLRPKSDDNATEVGLGKAVEFVQLRPTTCFS